jgi:hypothetical protein
MRMELQSRAMDFDSDDESLPDTRPRTSSVLILLVVAAGLFSYIGAYPMTNALAGANLIAPITSDHDPRPIWAGSAFVAMLLAAGMIALALRFMSRQQLKRIDTMEDA